MTALEKRSSVETKLAAATAQGERAGEGPRAGGQQNLLNATSRTFFVLCSEPPPPALSRFPLIARPFDSQGPPLGRPQIS